MKTCRRLMVSLLVLSLAVCMMAVGASAAQPCQHDGYYYVGAEAATCEADGHIAYYRCDDCGACFTQLKNNGKINKNSEIAEADLVLTATGHSFGDWEVDTDPTCTDKGVEVRACQNTGCTETEERDIEALGHNWNDGVETQKATETQQGIVTYTCQRCQATDEKYLPVLSPTPKTGDPSNMKAWILEIAVAVVVMAAVVLCPAEYKGKYLH